MIPRLRVWDKLNKGMCDVANIDFMTKVVELRHDIPFYFLPFSEVVLMQSTGLKDKNSVEIFEGDIVVNHVGDVWVISYFRGAFRYYPIESYSKDKEKPFETDSIGNFGTETFEVIGNIYEDTEWRINYV